MKKLNVVNVAVQAGKNQYQKQWTKKVANNGNGWATRSDVLQIQRG